MLLFELGFGIPQGWAYDLLKPYPKLPGSYFMAETPTDEFRVAFERARASLAAVPEEVRTFVGSNDKLMSNCRAHIWGVSNRAQRLAGIERRASRRRDACALLLVRAELFRSALIEPAKVEEGSGGSEQGTLCRRRKCVRLAV
jgi:hypothetical protein